MRVRRCTLGDIGMLVTCHDGLDCLFVPLFHHLSLPRVTTYSSHSQVMQAPPIQIYCHAKIHDTLGNIPFVTSPSFVSQPDPCSRVFFNQGFQFEADVPTPPSEPSCNPCHEGQPLVVQDENIVPTGCRRPTRQHHPTELGLTHFLFFYFLYHFSDLEAEPMMVIRRSVHENPSLGM